MKFYYEINSVWLLANGNGNGNGNNIPPSQVTGTTEYNLCLANYHDLVNDILITALYVLVLWLISKVFSF